MARRTLWLVLATVGVAALTILVFLVRSRGTGVTNWPVEFDLGSSDNGVLFQFARDLFTGKPLDWTFSPQVYVFPEIPISLVAYLIAGGAVQAYFLVVAAFSNALLFLALYAAAGVVSPDVAFAGRMRRALGASVPLLLLPLLGTVTLFEFQLGPTYYLGMYLVIIIAPVLFATRSWAVTIVLGVAIALTVASNPLALVFTVPAFALVLLTRWISSGFRSILRPAAIALVTVVLAAIIRVVFFTSLQGVSPLAYIDGGQVAARFANLQLNAGLVLQSPVSTVIILLGAVCAVGGLALGILVGISSSRRRRPFSRDRWSVMYFALVPATGCGLAAALLILNYLYLWPVLILPLVFALLVLPERWVPRLGSVLAAALVGVLVVSIVVVAPSTTQNWFSYRSAETECLDEKLPAGVTVGYAGYFEARRLELSSTRPFQLIQVDYPGTGPYYWLSNHAQARDNLGRFFYVDPADTQTPMSVASVENQWGTPSRQFSCGEGKTVLIYDDPETIAKLHATYSAGG